MYHWILIMFLVLGKLTLAEILITNTIEGETVSTELLLLRGEVDTSISSVTLSNLSREQNDITWPAAAGYFKTSILLREGSNILKLTAEGEEDKFITVMYNPLKEEDLPQFTRPMFILPSDWQIDDHDKFEAMPGEDNSQESAIRRLKLGSLMAQTITADLMEQEGLGKKTFRLERDEKGEVKITTHVSDWSFAEMTSYNSTLPLMNQMKDVEIKRDYEDWSDAGVAMITPVTRYLGGLVSPDIECFNDCDNIQAGEAWGSAGGLGTPWIGGGIVHSGTLYAWAEHIHEVPDHFSDDRNPYDFGMYPGRSLRGLPRTFGNAYAIILGAFLHEAGHGWGLEHSTGMCGVMKLHSEKVLWVFMATTPEGEAVGSREDENFCWEPMSLEILEDTPHFAGVTPLGLSPQAKVAMGLVPPGLRSRTGTLYNVKGTRLSITPVKKQAPGAYFSWNQKNLE